MDQGVSVGVTLFVFVGVTLARFVKVGEGLGVDEGFCVRVGEGEGVDEGFGVRVAVGLGVKTTRRSSAVRRHSAGTASSGSDSNACQSEMAVKTGSCNSFAMACQ